MAVICPTVTAYDTHQYREQMERVQDFAERLHIDFMDGDFAPTKSPGLEEAWWKDSDRTDIHLMYRKPTDHLEEIVRLSPSLVIVHAEADGNFVEFARELHSHDIKAGVALLAKTSPDIIKPAMDQVDHVLIFSGDLGNFGGKVDLVLLEKVKTLKDWKPEVEIGWDGGINDQYIQDLIKGGVDVLNVGGFIQRAENPRGAYDKLKVLTQKQT